MTQIQKDITELENAIEKAIIDFALKTGLTINTINVTHIEMAGRMCSSFPLARVEVTIKK